MNESELKQEINNDVELVAPYITALDTEIAELEKRKELLEAEIVQLRANIEEKQLGRAEVREIFRISRIGTIAGCYITQGAIPRSAKVRLVRDGIVIRDEISIESIRRLKDDVSEVRSGFECGIKLADFQDVKPGDLIEAYELIEISRTLESVQKQ